MKALMYKQEFEIYQSNPDPTPYNQQRQIWVPTNTKVVEYLEITKENFWLDNAFYEKLKLAELGQGDWPEVPETLTYTSLGWSRMMKKLEFPYESSYAAVAETEDDLWENEEQY